MKWIFNGLLALGRACLFLVLGVALCWRALNYYNPMDGSPLGPMLCVLLAVVLGVTGVAIAMRGSDFDAAPERAPAGQN